MAFDVRPHQGTRAGATYDELAGVEASDDGVLLDAPIDLHLSERALEEAGRLEEVGVDPLQRYGTSTVQAWDHPGHFGPVTLPHPA